MEAAVRKAADAVGRLPDVLSDLADAIDAGDGFRIAAAVGAATAAITAIAGATEEVSRALRTVAQGGSGQAEVEAFAAELAQRLFGYALASYLERERPLAGHLLGLVGVIESSPQAATPATPAHTRRVLNLARVSALIDDPVAVLGQLYGWGSPQFDWELLLRRLSIFLSAVTEFAVRQSGPPPFLRIALVDVGVTDDATPGVQAVLRIATSERVDRTLPLNAAMALVAQVDAAMEAAAAIQLLPPAQLRVVTPTAEVHGAARFGVRTPAADGAPPIVVVGTAGGSRIEGRTVRVTVGADLDWNAVDRQAEGAFVAEVTVEGGKVVLSLAGADGFLSSILPAGPLELDADVRLAWSSATGWHFHGTTGLVVDLPAVHRVGPVTVTELYLGVRTGGPGVALELACSIEVQLGPLDVVVEQIGAEVALSTPSGGGNLGPIDLSVRFKPPTGVGLAFDAGPAVGGGFLAYDAQSGEYAGALELQLGKVGVKAIGVLSTGPGDWSLALLLYAQIPPVQLGFGFTLDGIGGMVGVQRGVDVDQLVIGMRNGAFDDILFPPDPVGDAPRILGRLRTLFPARRGSVTVGPMVDVHWGKPALLTARLAVLFQLDNALGSGGGSLSVAQVLVVGQLHVDVGPTEEEPYARVVRLIVDVFGFWDLAGRRYGFLARLRDSSVGGVDITGGLGVWGEYGDQPRFLLAAGGFNPRFRDIPPQLDGVLDRLGATFSVGRLHFDLTGYFALTPATIQAGLDLRVTAKLGSVGLHGDIGFDVLVYRRPRTHFLADFHITAEITYRGHTLAGVKVTGTLEGPGRWHVTGTATFSILWWDISTSFDESWGSAAPLLTDLVDVAGLLGAALALRENWTAQLPAGAEAIATLAPRRGDPTPRAQPLGRFTFSQQVVPLGLTLDKFGDAAVRGTNHFTVDAVTLNGRSLTETTPGAPHEPVREHFARAQFLDMSEEDRLTRPSFERMDAGVAFSPASFETGAPIGASMAYETRYLDLTTRQPRTEPRPPVPGQALDYQLVADFGRHGAAGRAPQRATEQMSAVRLPITVSAPQLAAADPRTLHPVTLDTPPTTAAMLLEQQIHHAHPAGAQLVEAYELVGA